MSRIARYFFSPHHNMFLSSTWCMLYLDVVFGAGWPVLEAGRVLRLDETTI